MLDYKQKVEVTKMEARMSTLRLRIEANTRSQNTATVERLIKEQLVLVESLDKMFRLHTLQPKT